MAERARQGDIESRNELACQFLPLVFYCARRFGSFTYAVAADLIQEGNCGLLDAAAGYDPKFNVLFQNYAIPAIWRRMKFELFHQLPVKVAAREQVSSWNFEEIRKLVPSLDGFRKKRDDGKPSDPEVVRLHSAGLSPEKLLLAKEMREEVLAELAEFRRAVNQSMTPRQSQIFRTRYGLDGDLEWLTYKEAGLRLGITRQGVGMTLVRCWSKLNKKRYSEQWIKDTRKRLRLFDELASG